MLKHSNTAYPACQYNAGYDMILRFLNEPIKAF